jgi:hypothetical protein
MIDWRPIATAPKDYTWILLWFVDQSGPPEPQVVAGFWSVDSVDWFDSEAASLSLTELRGPPTHWAPLNWPGEARPPSEG